MTTLTNTGTGAAVITTVLAFSFGGVDMLHLGMGAGCYVIGAGCRAGLKIGAALEANPPTPFGRHIAVFSVSPFLGGFASLVMWLFARMVGFEGDAAIGLVLSLGGFRGGEGIQWMTSLVSQGLPKIFGGSTGQETKP
jgi:hypothetical protein